MSNGTSLNVGDAFLLETPPNDKHLFVAISEISAGKYLCVNITKKRSTSDTSCILKPSDPEMHNFIRHESVIEYKYAREINSAVIPSLISSGQCIMKAPFHSTVLEKIQKAALNSPKLKNRFKKNIKKFLGIIP